MNYNQLNDQFEEKNLNIAREGMYLMIYSVIGLQIKFSFTITTIGFWSSISVNLEFGRSLMIYLAF